MQLYGESEMAQSPDYAAFVAQAENAVKGLKDPELRRIAFQKVLDDLLAAGVRPVSPTARRRSGKVAQKTKKSKHHSRIHKGLAHKVRSMSAVQRIADSSRTSRHVRKVPEAEVTAYPGISLLADTT
jgi:hypothetical protein